MPALTVLDVFSGIGGFSLGLERAGWQTLGFIENDPFCNSVLARHWPDTPRWGDIRDVTFAPPAGQQLPEWASPLRVDLLCGGFPCQDLSVAGRRAGLSAPRSGLFFELVRLARELRPRWLLLENVPGLLSSNGGRDFAVVLAALGDAGYGVGWRVLDARWFGVPQRRRRVFLVGHLGAPCPPEVLFEQPGLPGHPPQSGQEGEDVAGSLTGGTERRGWRIGADEAAGRQLVAAPDTARALTAHGGSHGRIDGETETFIPSQEVSPPLRAEGHDASEDGRGRRAFAFAWQQGDDSPHTGTGRGRSWVARAGDYTGSLSTTRHDAVAFNHIQDPVSSPSVGATLGEEGQAVAVTSVPKMWDDRGIHRGTVSRDVTPTLNGYEQPMVLPAVRRLTPTECERLQAFEDGHTCLCGVQPYSTAGCRCPDGPRYAALGNAVTVNVVEWIARRLLAVQQQQQEVG